MEIHKLLIVHPIYFVNIKKIREIGTMLIQSEMEEDEVETYSQSRCHQLLCQEQFVSLVAFYLVASTQTECETAEKRATESLFEWG